MTEKNAIHAYVSEEAIAALDFLTDNSGASKTGIVQTWLENLHADLDELAWSQDSVDEVLGQDFLRQARRIDADKRRRDKRSH
jgi:hypothetical protein